MADSRTTSFKGTGPGALVVIAVQELPLLLGAWFGGSTTEASTT